MDLRAYEHAKFDLAELLRSAQLLAASEDNRQRIRECFVRLAEDRFNLVVVGRFSRGKTSLINALIGMDRLPTGIVPLTSVITSVTYGSKEHALIRYQGHDLLRTDIPLAALPEYVTQQRNPGNVKRVAVVEIRLPAEMLRRGFYFVDTPGLGSSIAENTRTTEDFLPEADAFLLVTSMDSPLADEELRILRVACASARRVFVVVNKQDMVSPEECEQVLGHVREQLRAGLGPNIPRIFPLSARDGLQAKRDVDPIRLAASGVEALEAELVRFLLEEKSSEFLLRLCDRVIDVLCGLPPGADAKRLAEDVDSLSRRIAASLPGASLRNEAATVAASDASQQFRSCEICTRIVDTEFAFLCHYQYELCTRPEVQRRHAERGGFCALHTWQYGALASTQGICSGYPALLEHFSERFRDFADAALAPQALSTALQALLPGADACVLCRERAQAEAEALASLAARLAEDREGTLGGLSVICLPHLRQLIARVDDADTAHMLLAREAALLDRLAEDMRRYATKYDAVRRLLTSDEETRSAQHALLMLAGHRNVHLAPTAS
ncbi:dynamin family protein [Herbaspirillum sp. ST 5-3]|uniref:dynamin family protein n=1 Tax=Oxalobacteraceae TaxID=75682 RepID=UPI0010A3D261|nr:dynamin family protein [Herbaspirillum sp. ST 5-3]